MNLIKIDSVAPQTPKRSIHLLTDGGRGNKPPWLAVLLRKNSALGRNDNFINLPLPQSLPNRLLGHAETIGMSGIDPIDSLLKGLYDRLNRFLLVLISPTHPPITPADCPSAHPYLGKEEVGVPKFVQFHKVKNQRVTNPKPYAS